MNGGLHRHSAPALMALVGALLVSGCTGTETAGPATPSSPSASMTPTASDSTAGVATGDPSSTQATSDSQLTTRPGGGVVYPDGRGPSGPLDLVVDGTWLVGEDIQDGRWRITFDDVSCSWSVAGSDNVALETGASQGASVTLDLQDGDLFTSSGCIVWNRLGPSNTLSAGPGAFTEKVGKPVMPGTYIAGRGIKTGMYSLVNPFNGPCEVSVEYEGRDGRVFSVLEYEASNFTTRTVPDLFVELEPGAIFSSDGCGDWQRYRFKLP